MGIFQREVYLLSVLKTRELYHNIRKSKTFLFSTFIQFLILFFWFTMNKCNLNMELCDEYRYYNDQQW